MTSKLLLFEYSSLKISEAVGAQNFEPLLTIYRKMFNVSAHKW